MGDASAREVIWRSLTDGCSYCDYRNATVRAAPSLPRPAYHLLFHSDFYTWAIPKKLNTETRVCCTKFGIVTYSNVYIKSTGSLLLLVDNLTPRISSTQLIYVGSCSLALGSLLKY